MSENKGKPSGKYAEKKTDPGRKNDLKRGGWPEEDSNEPSKNAARKEISDQARNRKAH